MLKEFLRSMFGGKSTAKSNPSDFKVVSAEEAGIIFAPESQEAYREVLRHAMRAAEDDALGKLHRAVDVLPWKAEA